MQDAVDLPDLYAGLARAVVNAVGADACIVSLLDDDRSLLRDAHRCALPPARVARRPVAYRLDDVPARRGVMERGLGVEIATSDPSLGRQDRHFLEDTGFARVLLGRLAAGTRPLGVVEAYRMSDRAFRRDDLEQIEVLCSFAANVYSRIRLSTKLEDHYAKTLGALASALEAKDPYTQQHTSRIREMAVAIAAAMQLAPDTRRTVGLGAILHDVGKIGIADAILQKPGPLTIAEWELMKNHPLIGERMLSDIDFLAPALPVIRHHHERCDGLGYPDGLEGEDIPLGARIVAVCDAFDAMTSDRPYRKALPVEVACDRLLRDAGTQFDPLCVEILVDVATSADEDRRPESFARYAVSA